MNSSKLDFIFLTFFIYKKIRGIYIEENGVYGTKETSFYATRQFQLISHHNTLLQKKSKLFEMMMMMTMMMMMMMMMMMNVSLLFLISLYYYKE